MHMYSRDPSCLSLPNAAITSICHQVNLFYMGTGDPSAGPHTGMAVNLPTELIPCPFCSSPHLNVLRQSLLLKPELMDSVSLAGQWTSVMHSPALGLQM